ncbi:MAG: galactosamine-6-phosphate isomerase [Tannerellaceae bacterium]|jgi:galactosamine-6-phosphate isomerase|nr:galactosamine-6-phosphate isomerase [Tannerellaceae bacterium]
MKIKHCPSYEALSEQAQQLVSDYLLQNPSMLLCTATGASPVGTYEWMVRAAQEDPPAFSRLRIIKLDEWGGLPMTHPGSCESFLQQHLVGPLGLTEDRYISFQSNPSDPVAECERIQQALSEQGPIDICIVGIGMNGHIALNEPAPELWPHCHPAGLADTSLRHPMIAGSSEQPTYGLTLGMADILQAKKIILLACGAGKETVIKDFLKGEISTALPASFLWLHPDVICLIDQT